MKGAGAEPTASAAAEAEVGFRRQRRRGSEWVLGQGERYGLVAVWAISIVVFGALAPHTFLTAGNFAAMFSEQSVLVILSLGLMLPLAGGDYDLSIAFTLTLAGMIVAVLNVQYHVPIAAAVGAAVAAGVVIGVINGLIVVVGGIDSFIATLGTGTVVGGITLLISNSSSISGFNGVVTRLTSAPLFAGLGPDFLYALLAAAAAWYLLEYTAWGMQLVFVGRNREVARLAGVQVGRIRFTALVCAGTVGALAGVVYVGTTGSADPTAGTSLLLPAFAAAFLGATCVLPGRFNAIGTLLAAYFLETGITGLSFLGAQVYVEDVFYGGALVIAVVVGKLARARLLARRRSAAR